FRLDLDHCAATGVTDDLVWVSPKSGRAVSAEAGSPYQDKLLVLPAFLRQDGEVAETIEEAVQGLKLTGFFIDHHIFTTHDRHMPQARARLVERLAGHKV
ncbi:MAG: DNA repair protein RecO C-terminal domain-containing protein, partial [Magnetovibrio sp.]|nr:DNA repair protein RecO C-terminal domain-containing protein [Magnetovibrio sp.]